jgi:Uma2 family endonuclease
MTALLASPNPPVSLPPPARAGSPALAGSDGVTLWQLSVEQYHDMISRGILGPRDPVELLDGLLVRKMPEDSVHSGMIDIGYDILSRLAPPGWVVRSAHPITTAESEPEPDIVVARGSRRDFVPRHPLPEECAIVVEVANSSVARDRGFKRELYARAGVPVYWILVLPERIVEVYTDPSGPAAEPVYGTIGRYADGESVPVVIDGREVGTVAVADLLP